MGKERKCWIFIVCSVETVTAINDPNSQHLFLKPFATFRFPSHHFTFCLSVDVKTHLKKYQCLLNKTFSVEETIYNTEEATVFHGKEIVVTAFQI